MSERSWDLDPDGRELLAASMIAAQDFHHSRCGTEHLLVGAARRPSLDQQQLLAFLGLTPSVVEVVVEYLFSAQLTRADSPLAPLPLSQRAEEAVRSRRLDGLSGAGWCEVLEGAVRDDSSGACAVLRALGKDVEWFRKALRHQMQRLSVTDLEGMTLAADGSLHSQPSSVSTPFDSKCVELQLEGATSASGFVEAGVAESATLRVGQLYAGSEGFGFILLFEGGWEVPPIFRPIPNHGVLQRLGPEVVQVEVNFGDGVPPSVLNGSGQTNLPAERLLVPATTGNGRSGRRTWAFCQLWTTASPSSGPIILRVRWPATGIDSVVDFPAKAIRAAATDERTEAFALEATWLPISFALSKTTRGGLGAGPVTGGQGDPSSLLSGLAPIVYSATWSGRSTIEPAGRLQVDHISLVAMRPTSGGAGAYRGARTENLGGRLVSFSRQDGPALFACWDESGLVITVTTIGVALDDLRMFISTLRASGH